MDERPAILPKGMRELIEAVRMYLDTDNCVCDEEGECPPDCEKCMYCVGWKAMWLAGEFTLPKTEEPEQHWPSGVVPTPEASEPDLVSVLTEAVAAAEEWLTEFGFDRADEGALELIKLLRVALKKAGSKIYEES